MIGLLVVAFVTVFAAGLKSSVAQVVDENFAGGLVIQNSDGFSPIPNGAAVAAREGARSRARSPRSARPQAKLVDGGAGARVSAPTRNIEEAVDDRMEEGRPGGAAPTCATARRSSPTPLPPTTTSKSAIASACSARPRRKPSFEVVGEFDSKLGVFGSVLITQAAMAREFGQTQDTIDFVETRRAPTPAEVQALLTGAGRNAPSRSPKC